MYLSDEKIFKMIVEIMDISKKPREIELLQNWVDEVGVDEAFKKIIQIHTTYSSV